MSCAVIRADGCLTAGDTQVIDVGVAPPGLLLQPALVIRAALWIGRIDSTSWQLLKTIPPEHRFPAENRIEIHLAEADLLGLPRRDMDVFGEIELRGPTIGVKTLPHFTALVRAQRIL